MSARIDGLDQGLRELQDALERLPENLQTEAAGVIEERTQSAAGRIRAELGQISQRLADSVEVKKTRELSRRVSVRAPDAHLVEYGSKGPRATKAGANRGTMPANPIVGRVAHEERKTMRRQLLEIIRKGIPGFAPDRVDEQ